MTHSKIKWLRCTKCGKLDKTDGLHIGTQEKMRCIDCCTTRIDSDITDTHATMCRDCCPTEHGTKWNREAQ